MRSRKIYKRSPEQMDYDVIFETDLFLKGYTYRQISQKLNDDVKRRGFDYEVSHVTIYKDMQKVMINWKKEAFDNMDAYMRQELKKLDKMEVETWEAWENSKSKYRTTEKKSKKPKKVDADTVEVDYYGYDQTMNETSAGNPRFLDILLNIQQRRAKLLGLDSPIKLNVDGGPDRSDDKPKYNPKAIPDDILFAAVDAIQQDQYNEEMKNKINQN